MTTLQIPLPEALHEELKTWATRENISVEQLAAAAVADKISALAQLAYLQDRASRADRNKYLAVLAKVPDVPPIPPDTAVPESRRR
ncbi:MAG TPA: hypothetical protein VGI40_19065 [Pirellulaceae bacterium]|jgi:hypothetical protein